MHVGNNEKGFCSSITISSLNNDRVDVCVNSSKTRQYVINQENKNKIKNGFINNGVNLNDIAWIGEFRTSLKNGTLLSYGYSMFINED